MLKLGKFSPTLFLFLMITVIFLSGCQQNRAQADVSREEQLAATESEVPVNPVEAKKVLYVDSYHVEYEPGIMARDAVQDILEPAGVEIDYIYMDEKNKTSEEEQQQAALAVKEKIETWQPDLVIAADDSASKHLVMPYYKDADIPFVFIGVNWDATQYGYPYSNATGQVEVELIKELIADLQTYAKGDRVGLLSGKTLTDESALGYYENVLDIEFDRVELVDNFETWQEVYVAMQDEVDVLLVRNNSGIEGWDDEAAKDFVREETRIPTGSVSTHLGSWVLMSYAKVNQEFGEYAGTTALEILRGQSPEDIPITTNKQAKVYLNMSLAKGLNIKFPIELIDQATLLE